MTLPLAGRGLLASAVVMWARAVSEFGAIVILTYNPKVASVLSYDRFTSFGLSEALPVAAVLALLALLPLTLLRTLRRDRGPNDRARAEVVVSGLRLRDVSARKGRFALDSVQLELGAREYGVVIGPAGAGKTTLLEVVAGLLAPESGSVELGGVAARGVPPEARDIGLVYQHAFLFPHLSVRENVCYGARVAADAHDVAERFGVTELYARDVNGLSGGERQLVALARALARRPALLLLDEPFSALDPRRRAVVRREVRAMHREWGLTTLQVTHDFAEAGMLGDRAILLDAGRVLQQGTPAEVFRRPASPYVAEFLGAENVLGGSARELGELAGLAGGRSGGVRQGSSRVRLRVRRPDTLCRGRFCGGRRPRRDSRGRDHHCPRSIARLGAQSICRSSGRGRHAGRLDARDG